MPHLNLLLDAHDRERLKAVALVPYEKTPSQGRILLRLVYHADTFKPILNDFEVPPADGERRYFCMNVTEEERAKIRELAGLLGLEMTPFMRALILYHHDLRQSYIESLPGLTYAENAGRWMIRLSFQPDRIQPWYSHHTEHKAIVEGRAKESRVYWVEQMRARGNSEEEIADFLRAVEDAKEMRADYDWDEKVKAPGEVREEEQRADNQARPRGFNYRGDDPYDRPGIDWERLVVVAVWAVFFVVGGAGLWWGVPAVLPYVNQIMAR
jgi:hypothetical protein